MGGREDDADSDQFINIRNQATLSLAGNFVDAAISFLGLVLFANVLGADGLGKFYVVLAIVKVLLFPIAGVGQSVMKRGSERGLDPAAFFGGGLTYGGVYALCAGGVVVGFLFFAPHLLQYSPAIVAGAFAVFASRIFYMLLLDTYRSHGKTGFATLTDNAHGIVETGVQVVFLLAGFGVLGLLAGTALTTVVVGVVILVASEISVRRPTIKTLRSIARFAKWSVITSGLGTVYDRLPVLVLGIVLGNTAAGYYTSAMRLLMLGSYVGGSIAPALMVRVSATEDTDGGEPSLSDLQLSMRYAAVLAIPMMFGSFAIPDMLMVTVFGPTFADTGAVLAVLSLYHIVNTYDTVQFSFFDGINRPEYATKLTVVALAIRLLATAVLLVWFGLLGVVAAVVVSHAVHLLTGQAVLRTQFGRWVFPTGISRQFGSALVMWGVVVSMSGVVPIRGWLTLLSVVVVGAAVYGAALLTLDEYLRRIGFNFLRETVLGA